MSEEMTDELEALCPKCDGELLEIRKDEYPNYVSKDNVEGFRHRFVCKRCGNETIYNTVKEEWEEIPETIPYRYGKKGNRLLYTLRKEYLEWIRHNWDEIQKEFVDYCIWAGQIDEGEYQLTNEWVAQLEKEDIILQIRQISDEITDVGDYGCGTVMISLELQMLADRLENLITNRGKRGLAING
jgi:hypothetical protein